MSTDFIIAILIQAINASGSISADWVLVGLASIAFFLFWRMLYKIERGLEKVATSVAAHDTKLQLHESFIEDIEEDLKALQK